jgi:tetratricopeptide (TPR) repeat protein
MAIEDIERLKEKLEKDPTSKLFVPLAEEYKKAGLLDEAIEVLTKGLERQPGYLSARVSLGKIYIERGMLDEAITEFDKVIAVIPDNLYAHKKLAEIYKDLGKRDEAIREFKTVLRINPADAWAATNLAPIEQETAPQPQGQPLRQPEATPPLEKEPAEIFPLPGEQLGTEEEKAFDVPLTPRDLELSRVLSEVSKEEPVQEKEPLDIPFNTEETALWGVPAEPAEETKEEPTSIPFSTEETALWGVPAEPVEETKEERLDIPFSTEETEPWGVSAEPAEETKEEPSGAPAKAPISKEDMELWRTHLEAVEGIDTKSAEEVEPTVEFEEIREERSLSFEDILKEPEVPAKEMVVKEKASPSSPITQQSVEDADAYILQGKYWEAMNVYKTILSGDPGSKNILQRIEELRGLLKLLGKDKDELITKLDRLLLGIKKRRDEFSGST